MKILNLYAGIGGNRKLWGDEHEITAVEIDPKIAEVYKKLFPKDKVIVGDAHEYLLEHYKEFDFIWSSPPCPSHSRIRQFSAVARGQNEPIYPDMTLYQEIIFLKFNFKGLWLVENVISYYEPLIKPIKMAQHYWWSNFDIPKIKLSTRKHNAKIKEIAEHKGFDLDDLGGLDKRKVLRNCVEPKAALHIFKCAFKDKQKTL